MQSRAERPTAAIDEERVRRGHGIDSKKGEGGHPSDRRGPRGARHGADLLLLPRDGIAADRRRIALDPEAEELPADLADVRSAGDGLLADIAAFREAERRLRRDLKRERLLRHVRAEARDARLDPQDVVRLAADRRGAGADDRLPRPGEVRPRRPDREAPLSRRPAPRDVTDVALVDGEAHVRVEG